MKWSLLLLVFLLCLSPIAALGISPARQRAELTSDVQYLSVSLENSDDVHAYFKVSFSGSLASYAHHDGQLVFLSSDMNNVDVSFSLSLPEELPPGLHKLNVHLSQVPGDDRLAMVGSLLELVALVSVDVPAHGNFVSGEVSVGQQLSTGDVPITVRVVNKGDAAVAVWADFSIKNPGNEEVSFWSSERELVGYLDDTKIATFWRGEKNPGLYTLEVFVHHAEKTTLLQQSFLVGKKEVVPIGLSADSFSLGEIVPVDVLVRNKWNALVEDVSAEVFVLDAAGRIVQSFETLTKDMQSFASIPLRGYWDTDRLLVGNYDLSVVVSFDGGESQEIFPVTVNVDSLLVEDVLTGNVAQDEDDETSSLTLFMVLVVLLLGANVFVAVLFLRKRKK